MGWVIRMDFHHDDATINYGYVWTVNTSCVDRCAHRRNARCFENYLEACVAMQQALELRSNYAYRVIEF